MPAVACHYQGTFMLIKIRTSADLPYSEVTPEAIYRSRREFMKTAAAGAVGAAGGRRLTAAPVRGRCAAGQRARGEEDRVHGRPEGGSAEHLEQITSYNNYYEFGTDKDDPGAQCRAADRDKPWTVKVDGLVDKPGDYGVEDLVDFKQLEERVYRHRCVEAWSMVIPWIGVPARRACSAKVQPQSKAQFVEFTTL